MLCGRVSARTSALAALTRIRVEYIQGIRGISDGYRLASAFIRTLKPSASPMASTALVVRQREPSCSRQHRGLAACARVSPNLLAARASPLVRSLTPRLGNGAQYVTTRLYARTRRRTLPSLERPTYSIDIAIEDDPLADR